MSCSDQTDSSVAKIPSDKPLSREDGSGAAAPADDIPESEDVSVPSVFLNFCLNTQSDYSLLSYCPSPTINPYYGNTALLGMVTVVKWHEIILSMHI